MRKKNLLTQWAIILFASFLNATAFASTQTDVDGAYQTVKGTTDRVLTLATEAKNYYDRDPDRFYGQIRTILDEVTDFQSFARSVMGRYAGKPAMTKLDAAGKAKLQTQIEQFAQVFREGLVKTYAIGLLNFNGQKIEVVPPKANPSDASDSIDVVQLVYGTAPKPYVVQYKLRVDSDNKWKVRNVTIEGINLGVVYRNQFESAMTEHKNDIDKVIANWSVAADEDVKAASSKNKTADTKETTETTETTNKAL
jgi:phospholipid transport system substrate-binding protein